jgi:Ca-activated chloride channel family protein
MKMLSLIVVTFVTFSNVAFATGILVRNEGQNDPLYMMHDSIDVMIYDQVAQVTCREYFVNQFSVGVPLKYVAPLNEGASPVRLRWQSQGIWYDADFSAQPMDSSFNGNGNGSGFLYDYYGGENPFYFEFNSPLQAGDTIIIELSYVMLLPYEFGITTFFYNSDFSQVAESSPQTFFVNCQMNCERTIEMVQCQNPGAIVNYDEHLADMSYGVSNSFPDDLIELNIQFDGTEFGLFGYSTFDSSFEEAGCDSLGKGFVGFIVEPALSEEIEVINKTFTLIIDHSGSMSGPKIQQAREASAFIMNHLNEGDYFNLVKFSSGITSFAQQHVPFNAQNQISALEFIDNIDAEGSTNISGAFATAIPHFADADDDMAHIIIFFTDGQATVGETNSQNILQQVYQQRLAYDPELVIFTFGIGSDVNESLLAQMAIQNNGLYEFADAADLNTTISNFYLMIQNPILLNVEVAFDPPIVQEIYPQPLQNIYLGQQLRVFGRYEEADSVNIILSGQTYGQDISYSFPYQLADSVQNEFRFVSKMWADQKIRSLQNEFYSTANTQTQSALQNEITDISMCFGVLSDFTSFVDNSDPTLSHYELEFEDERKVIPVYPNPFQDHFTLEFPDLTEVRQITVCIYDSRGVLVYTSPFISVNGGVAFLQDAWLQSLPEGIFLIEVITDIGVFHQTMLHDAN